jgi:DNA polymerase-1
MGKNEDAKKDSRIRPSFNYLRVVTGRTSANNPNLQQVPSRGKLSKYIKRVFIARPNTIFIKVDYSAHEVRGWSLISGDKNVAGAFQKGIDLYANYVKQPTPENLKKFEDEGDIHIINSSYFFGLKVSEVTKDIRQSVKGVTFGLIYGRSAKSLSVQLNKPIDEVNSIIDKFFTRFKVASNWLLEIEKFARKNYYVEAPTGLRRHLWPYLLPKTKDKEKAWNSIAAACDRRARNSPIQGMGSGIGYSAARYLETWTFERFKEEALESGELPIRNQNMVHDSIELEINYSHVI